MFLYIFIYLYKQIPKKVSDCLFRNPYAGISSAGVTSDPRRAIIDF